MPSFRRRLGWLLHCFKAVFRSYHHQLLPLFDIILKPDDLVIDVGAHAGQFSKIFSRRTPNGLVLAIEPATYPFTILRIVKFLHRLHSMRIIKIGISVQQGDAVLHTPVKKSGVVRFGLSRITNNTDSNDESVLSEDISVTTIDSLIKQFGTDRKFSLLKADIEGYEYEMLCGAEQAVEKSRPCILMEVSINKKEIMEFLLQRNYIIYALLNYSGKSREPIRLARIKEEEEPGVRNILAVSAANGRVIDKFDQVFCSAT